MEKQSNKNSKNYITPEYKEKGFHCPHCDTYANQNWYETHNHNYCIKGNMVAFCDHCNKYSIWVDKKMVFPDLSPAPLPIDEMPEPVKELYNEARNIFNKSPRGACALLRLAVQLLVKDLGENEKNLSKAIGNLVDKGLPKKIQEALDSVRVIGNNAVHPGEINIKEDPKIVNTLFELLNFISEKMIKDDKKIERIFSFLPKNSKEAIKKRDGKNIQ